MSRVDQIARLLWPPGFATRGAEVYAVFDGARDRRIHERACASGQPWCCLYAGELPAELRSVAPYLVHMAPDALFTREVIATGWGHAWGIWLVSAAPLHEVRRHLRRFLQVQDEAGRRLLFRFYDPIVLATYLPTCTLDELATLFGPIDAFLLEQADARLAELRFDGAVLHARLRLPDAVPA